MLRFKRIIKYLFIGLLSLLTTGTVCEQIILIYLNMKKPGEAQFVQVNGNQVHFVKKGTGAQTVIFQSGLGSDHKIWEDFQDSLSRYTTTILYDRSGLLWSEGSKNKKRWKAFHQN